MITEACITYLSMEEYGSESRYSGLAPANPRRYREESHAENMDPLYGYAACNWGHHARKASGVHHVVIGFFGLSWNLRCAALMSMVPLITKERARHRSGVDWWRPDEDSTSGIHLSAHFGLHDILVALLQQGYDVNERDRLGHTALMLAAQSGHLDTVRLLLHHGAKTDSRNKCGYSLLHCAVHSGYIDIVQLVIADKAVQKTMNAVPHSGKGALLHLFSPLEIAVDHEYVDIVRLLINRREDVNLQVNPKCWAEFDMSPFGSAARKDNRQIVDMLLEAGADIHGLNQQGQTALNDAACGHKTSLVHYLLSKGANIDQQNQRGETPLLHLYHSDFMDGTYFHPLLYAGADTNVCDERGRSILHWATSDGRSYLIPILIDFGAKVSLISNHKVRVCCIEKLRRYLRSPGRLKEDREKWIAHRQREKDLRTFPSSLNRTWEEFKSNNLSNYFN